jgi:transcriptional antiterminator NusG
MKKEEIKEEKEKKQKKWYIVHTYSGMEEKTKKNLEQSIDANNMHDRIFRVEVPVDWKVKLKDGKRQIVPEKVYPGYVLVEMIMDDDTWFVVRNTPGVLGFVGGGGKPTPLADEEVRVIMNRIGIEEAKAQLTFSVGDTVRVMGGPFDQMIGKVEEIYEDKEKAKVRLSIFGRDIPVEIDFVHLEKI